MLKKLSSKIIFMFFLMLLSFSFSAIISYITVDTQKQHILLTDLLGEQKLFIERVTYSTSNLADIAIMSKLEFENKKNKINSKLEKNIKNVEKRLIGFKENEFIVDGELVHLKFRKEFEIAFMDVIEKTLKKWYETKSTIYFLSDYNNMKNKEIYLNRLEEFKKLNFEILEKSDEISEVCRDEAEYKKIWSSRVQLISVIISILVFLTLFLMMINDFYRPIQEIKVVFDNMSKGEISQSFTRKKDDEFKDLYDKFNKFIENLKIIFSLEDKVLSESSIRSIMEFIDINFKKFIPFKYIALVYKSKDDKIIELDLKNKKEFSGKIKEFSSIELDGNKIILPIKIDESYLGYVYFEFDDTQSIEKVHINFLELIKDKISLGFYKSFLVKELLAIVTGSLANMAESKDPETGRHLTRMSMYSEIVANRLYDVSEFESEIDEEFIENIRITAPMHDIGKVSIRDKILLKAGKLTDEEFEIMKTHASAGGIILKNIDIQFQKYGIKYFRMAADIAYSHQEKYDGSGYPKALKEENIPLSGRITAIADVFDALSSKRPYKEAFSLEKSYDIIRSGRGKHFDPKVVDAFFESLEKIEEVYNEYKEI